MQIVEKLSMVHIVVSEIEKVKEFYADKLGLKVTADKAYGNKRSVSMEFPGGGTSIAFTSGYENMKPGAYTLYLSSLDVEAAYKELISKGVKPTKELSHDWRGWEGRHDPMFVLSDPDGNQLLIVPV